MVIKMNVKEILNELTLEEKAALLSGTDFMYTNPVPRLHIPAISMSDGPHGLRKQIGGSQDNGISESEPATSFPTAATTASSWNTENVYQMGKAIAAECANYEVDILLGPGVNIKKNPLCGRNFEYFSEDPLLAGAFGAAEVKGIQENVVGVSVKHFALNNSENYRFMGNSVADERAIREIYLKPFEKIVKEAAPLTMMCAYNRINGTYCSENSWLLMDVLRKEWGFDGAVMSDWGATHQRVDGVAAGLDLEMPGDTAICRKWITDAVNSGVLPEEKLNQAVENMLNLIKKCQENKKKQPIKKGELTEQMRNKHHDLAAEIAMDSAVLLKNDGMLPLRETDSFLVVGELFEKMRYQGAGSSMIHPARLSTPQMSFEAAKMKYQYVKGYHENQVDPEEKLIAEAIDAARDYDKILIFAGLTDYVEGEGADREHMRLPENQLQLIEKLCTQKKDITVILYGGSSMELPFADKVNAILDMYLPGQNGGYATAGLLFGKRSPSGRLAETWVKKYEDVPFGQAYGKSAAEVYKESIYVGYRYYQTAKKEVRYPFGYGLSYTEFAYQDFAMTFDGKKIEVTGKITNIGKMDGAEVVQCYVSGPRNGVWKPERELKAFTKLYLKQGETGEARFTIPVEELTVFLLEEKKFVLEKGIYSVQICKDANTVIWWENVELQGKEREQIDHPKTAIEDNVYQKAEDIYGEAKLNLVTDRVFEAMSGVKIPPKEPSLPITLESRFTDLNQTFMGRILFKAVLSVAAGSERKARKLPEGAERDNKLKGALFLKRILESNSVISMSMSAGRAFPYHFACGVVEMANGHIFRGIRAMCRATKVAQLPKEQD